MRLKELYYRFCNPACVSNARVSKAISIHVVGPGLIHALWLLLHTAWFLGTDVSGFPPVGVVPNFLLVGGTLLPVLMLIAAFLIAVLVKPPPPGRYGGASADSWVPVEVSIFAGALMLNAFPPAAYFLAPAFSLSAGNTFFTGALWAAVFITYAVDGYCARLVLSALSLPSPFGAFRSYAFRPVLVRFRVLRFRLNRARTAKRVAHGTA